MCELEQIWPRCTDNKLQDLVLIQRFKSIVGMKGVKGGRQLLVVKNGVTPPFYGKNPQEEVGYKDDPFLLHSLKIKNCQNVLLQLSAKLAEMETYPAFISHVFCVPCCLFETFLSRMSQFDFSFEYQCKI